MVTWTCVQAERRRCHPMGDGTDPVSAASGPDSGLKGSEGRDREREVGKPALLLKCFNKKLTRYTDDQKVINTQSQQLVVHLE